MTVMLYRDIQRIEVDDLAAHTFSRFVDDQARKTNRNLREAFVRPGVCEEKG